MAFEADLPRFEEMDIPSVEAADGPWSDNVMFVSAGSHSPIF